MTVSVNTARKLELAGFPQPQPNEGQHWFHKKTERVCVVMHNVANYRFRISYFGSAANKGGSLNNVDFVYMPTATDILRELGEQYVLWFDGSPKIQKWLCAKAGTSICSAGKPIMNNNPAEAAAAAWLQLKGKHEENT